jgi:hypothetical protein
MPQISYLQQALAGYAGELADNGENDILSYRNDETVDMPLGVFAAQNTTVGKERGAKLPASSTDKLVGLIINTMARNVTGLTTGSYKSLDPVPMLARGRAFVSPEQSVKPTDDVYVRFAPSINTPALVQLGAVRKDADGALGVLTITPTAANGAIYILRVEVTRPSGAVVDFEFEYIGDGSATADEIVTGLKTEMLANAEFSALVTASGTVTLILTGVSAGQVFVAQSMGDGVLAVVTTTPAAPTARLAKGARFMDAAAAAGTVVLEVNIPASRV